MSRLESQFNTFNFSPLLPVAEVPRRWSLARRLEHIPETGRLGHASEATLVRKPVSLPIVLMSLLRSHRAVAAFAMTLAYG